MTFFDAITIDMQRGGKMKTCPITCGLPTRMTKQCFERICRENRQKGTCTYISSGGKGQKKGFLCALPAKMETSRQNLISSRQRKSKRYQGASRTNAIGQHRSHNRLRENDRCIDMHVVTNK
jgi:hypothetical protein